MTDEPRLPPSRRAAIEAMRREFYRRSLEHYLGVPLEDAPPGPYRYQRPALTMLEASKRPLPDGLADDVIEATGAVADAVFPPSLTRAVFDEFAAKAQAQAREAVGPRVTGEEVRNRAEERVGPWPSDADGRLTGENLRELEEWVFGPPDPGFDERSTDGICIERCGDDVIASCDVNGQKLAVLGRGPHAEMVARRALLDALACLPIEQPWEQRAKAQVRADRREAWGWLAFVVVLAVVGVVAMLRGGR